MPTEGLSKTPKNVILSNGETFPDGQAWTWNPAGLQALMPPALNAVWDQALAAMGTSNRTTKVLTAIAATRTLLAVSAQKLQGTQSISGFASAMRWVAVKGGTAAGQAIGGVVGASATIALSGPITAGVAAVSTSMGVTAGTAIAAGSALALGAATAGIGAVAVLACVGIANAIAGAFDKNCCDHDNCDWTFDYRFGGKPASAFNGGIFGNLQSILKPPPSTFPDPKTMKWDNTIDTFSYVVARLDWDTQAAIAGSKCPGPDLGAGVLIAAAVLAAWDRANPTRATEYRSEQPMHLNYVLQPNEAPGSTFLGYDGFAIMLLGLAVANKIGANDIIQFPANVGAVNPLANIGKLMPIKMKLPAPKPAPAPPVKLPKFVIKIPPLEPPKPVAAAPVKKKHTSLWVGVASGATVGAAAGGPIGAAIGAGVGAAGGYLYGKHKKT